MIRYRILAAVLLSLGLGAAEARAIDPQECVAFAATTDGLREIRKGVLAEINEVRRANRRNWLTVSVRLDRAAQDHAEDMASRRVMSHFSADESTAGDRARRAAYIFKRVQENVAVGDFTVDGVVQAWLDSPSHREAMLWKEAEEVGIGFAIGERPLVDEKQEIRGCYWVLVLGDPLFDVNYGSRFLDGR